eukprot:GILK01009458.1.p1 GENE.GILK01009458.1~~GILK01009458.1.p1  ORF type:complete len:566 (+),score=98.71 GILK01009458.1:147-1700(+)
MAQNVDAVQCATNLGLSVKALSSDKIVEEAKNWSAAFTRRATALQPAQDVVTFWFAYNAIVHSSQALCETLYHFETSFAKSLRNVLDGRDVALRNKERVHAHDIEIALQQSLLQADIESMIMKHVEDVERAEMFWQHEISEVKKRQKHDYREFVLQMLQDSDVARQVQQDGELLSKRDPTPRTAEPTQEPTQDRFWVYLGAQLKSIFELRLIQADLMKVCEPSIAANPSSSVGSTRSALPPPHIASVQTLKRLYLNQLSAVIRFTNDDLSFQNQRAKDLLSCCESSTEFHFSSLSDQFAELKESLAADTLDKHDRFERSPGRCNGGLQVGDFYVTKHSNLAHVHLIFHLVLASTSTQSNLQSSMPRAEWSNQSTIVNRLKELISFANRYDVRCIYIPLVLEENCGVPAGSYVGLPVIPPSPNKHHPNSNNNNEDSNTHRTADIQETVRRIETVVRTVKSALADIAHGYHRDRVLELIQFTVPSDATVSFVAKCRTMIQDIFQCSSIPPINQLNPSKS